MGKEEVESKVEWWLTDLTGGVDSGLDRRRVGRKFLDLVEIYGLSILITLICHMQSFPSPSLGSSLSIPNSPAP